MIQTDDEALFDLQEARCISKMALKDSQHSAIRTEIGTIRISRHAYQRAQQRAGRNRCDVGREVKAAVSALVKRFGMPPAGDYWLARALDLEWPFRRTEGSDAAIVVVTARLPNRRKH